MNRTAGKMIADPSVIREVEGLRREVADELLQKKVQLERDVNNLTEQITNLKKKYDDEINSLLSKIGGVSSSIPAPVDISMKITGPASAVSDNIFVADGSSGKVAKDGGAKISDLTTSISGKVAGPGASVDGHVALFDGTTGKLIKSSGMLIAETGTVVSSVPSRDSNGRINAMSFNVVT